ncbi:hypothetical protein GLYMA_05G220300v4 [Glycine max]|uniref:SH3 domain-containing protein n=1 Tax=Glycine max TaxID=3847 RepID=I1K661_SOYBN|nr:uncharacterized protein LOC100805441 [Glycine max]KAH1135726.1 hypothetical protein GYH30_013445 [Glycine max]KRH60104.1 hypothetical protein GLYMA_05G220300v4 [Glycine max]|eukprot:XP_006580501.1 uncharacterized protein LOC100805441 [Glycine max]
MADSSGTTLMDLITADPTPAPSSSSTAAASSAPTAPASLPSALGKPPAEKKSKRAALMQIQNDTISAAKAALHPVRTNIMPQRQKKKPVSYSQLARSIHELAATSDQKSSQRQLVHHVFPKLAVYNSVDPSLAPSLLMLNQQCEDRSVLRYVYYYLARILSDTGPQGLSTGGGIPTPNWDALADIDAVGGVTRADVVPRIVEQLTAAATNAETEFHARRLQSLKALTYAPSSNSDVLSRLYEIVFGILEKVGDAEQKRKKGIFGVKGGDKDSIIRSNLQYAALSALRRLPLDPGNPAFLHYAVQGISFADPVAVRHALEIVSEIATMDPYAVAMALGKHVQPGGALQDVLHLHDVLARVSLARLCCTISRARALDERSDIRSQFNSVLYQLLLDPSERVCFEAILCVLGKYDNAERTEERAAGWYRLTREILKLPDASSKESSKDKQKTKRPQLLIKLVMRRLESSFRSFSRPVLHAAARVVQEMGKSRAAAFALGIQDVEEGAHVNTFAEATDYNDSDESTHPESIRRTSSVSNLTAGRDTVSGMLASLMEVVRTTVACECVYVRAMVIKALIWMQGPFDSFDELESIIASELSDPAWPAALLNDVLLTLHARFKASPDMAVTLLQIARIFATKVPGKVDADVLQLLWKTCLVGAGPDGKHKALEAVTIVLDLPPPQPGSMLGLTSVDRVSASDPKSALALQRLVQAAVWFLGENANYAASEYAWESATPPGTALMMLDADKMVAAASSRNPTLAGALTRLQRCAFNGSWEIRIIAAQALTTMAIRSGEPFRLQIYEFLHTLGQGGLQSQFSDMHLSNGEDQGASGTGLGVLLSPMIKVLDEMYRAQDDLIKEIRNHDNAKKEWTDDELKKLYETHERLLDLVSLFCYVPRTKYLPLGPISAKLIDIYRTRHNISASTGLSDPAVATGISDLVYESQPPAAEPDTLDDDLVNAWAANLGDDGLWGNNAPAMNRVNEFLAGAGTDAPEVDEENMISRPSVSYDDMWAKTLLESSELEEDDAKSLGSSSPDSTGSVETSISSHFGGMSYPSLFSSRPQTTDKAPASRGFTYEGYGSPIREEPPSYSSSVIQRHESFENPLAGNGSHSFGSQDDEQVSSANPQHGSALYDFTAGGDDELSLTAGEEVEIEYEVDGWFYVKKKRPGRDGKMAGLVPVLYVTQS